MSYKIFAGRESEDEFVDISNTDYSVFAHHTVVASGNVSVNKDNNQEKQCTYKRSIEARLSNHVTVEKQ